jgi:hypothetical protein
MKKVDRLLELIEPAAPAADLAARSTRAAFAGEPIIEAPTFWQRLLPMAVPAAIAVALALILLWLSVGDERETTARLPVEEAGVADILAGGDVDYAVIDAVLVLEDL